MANKRSNVSVIIPTYNRAQLLLQALKSVQKQTLSADEVIVVDDGSTDTTQEIVHRYFPNFRYVYQENKGVSAARNLGISKANNIWVAFLDSDDEWLPNKLAIQMEMLTRQPRYMLCHTDEIWIRNGKRVNPMKKHKKYGGCIFSKCLPLCLISPSSVVIHRDLFEEIGLFDESLPACEDYDLWLRVCSRYSVLFIDTPLLIKYGGHQDQLSRRYWGMDRFRIYTLEKIIQSAGMPMDEYRDVVNVLLQKIDIYVQGAKKRGRQSDVIYYESKKKEYLDHPLLTDSSYPHKVIPH